MKLTRKNLINVIKRELKIFEQLAPIGGEEQSGYGRTGSSQNFDKQMDFHKKVLHGIIARDFQSKDYDHLLALDGGSVGIAHFAASGLNSLYNAMGDSLAQKYFNRSVKQLKKDAAKEPSGDCRGKTPRGKNDNGTGCYRMDWWREGMEKFVGDGNKDIQYNAWKNLVVIPGNKIMDQWDQTKWGTQRARAIGYGIQNSTGDDGLLRYSSNGKNDPEKTLKNYVGSDSHRKRRKDAIDKHFPQKNKVSESTIKLSRRQLSKLIQESMRIDGLDRVFDQIDSDSPAVNTQPLPMAGARETFSQDTGLFGSNIERPDDMRDMSVSDEDRIFRQASKMEEARYALVYFRAYISILSLYMKIHYVHAQEWKDWKRTPGAMSALNLVTRKVNTGFGTMTDAVYDHGNPQTKVLREAEVAGKMDAEEKIRLEGYANAYIAVNDMVFVGHNHHLMPIQTAAETLGDRELVSLMGIFEGFDEDVNDGKVLELFDFLDRFDHEYQVLR